MEVLPIAAIVLSVIAIVVSVYTLITFNKKRLGRRAVKDIVYDEISGNENIHALIRSLLKKNEVKHNVTLTEDEFNAIVASVVAELNQKEDKPSPIEKAAPIPSAETAVRTYLYASSFDKDKGTFFTVGKDLFPKAIFKISVNPENENLASFTVLESAYDKAAEVKDFLEGCTKVYGIGNTLTVKKEGSLVKRDGIWTVEEPIEIQFV